MLCQKCQLKEANVQLRLKVNGNERNLNLCQSCYQTEKQKSLTSFGPALSGFSGFGQMPLEDFFKKLASSQGNENFQPLKEAPGQNQGNGGFIDQFGRNLTQLANAGLIDPVIGRDEEINRVTEILNRRSKNNPVLIGEPGVGKTAIAEGLAVKIAEGRAPKKLQNKEVYLLDVASLVANTGIRGQFEERMKQLISELQTRKNIILFIDEIHLLVGAGSAEGSMDAGNILKPALARGELQVVGATTLKEYRQIEKDPALERRFQPVQVNEPTADEAVDILMGLKQKYEDYHDVSFTEDAIRSCVELSSRYIQDRFLPDKAIDLMDEAGSKMNLQSGYIPAADIEYQLKEISRLKEIVLKEEKYEEAAKLREEELKLQQALNGETRLKGQLLKQALFRRLLRRKQGFL